LRKDNEILSAKLFQKNNPGQALYAGEDASPKDLFNNISDRQDVDDLKTRLAER
jgi:hypothetical protein